MVEKVLLKINALIQFYNCICILFLSFKLKLFSFILIAISHINAQIFKNVRVFGSMRCLDMFRQFPNNNAQMSANVIEYSIRREKNRKSSSIWLKNKEKMFFNRLTNFVLKTNQVANFEVSNLFSYYC